MKLCRSYESVRQWQNHMSSVRKLMKDNELKGRLLLALTVYILHANSNIVHHCILFLSLSVLFFIGILFFCCQLVSLVKSSNTESPFFFLSVDMNNSCLFPGVKELIRTFWNWEKSKWKTDQGTFWASLVLYCRTANSFLRLNWSPRIRLLSKWTTMNDSFWSLSIVLL